jgi:hypothetical protein
MWWACCQSRAMQQVDSDNLIHIADYVNVMIDSVHLKALGISNSFQQVGDGHCSLLQSCTLATLAWHMLAG